MINKNKIIDTIQKNIALSNFESELKSNNKEFTHEKKWRIKMLNERIFYLPDKNVRYFQIKDDTGCQVLVQDNSGEDATPSLPYRYDGSDEAKRTCCSGGKEWCLDRCMGVIDVKDRDSIFATSNTDIVEVRPC